jgi:hypothetical protein
LFRATIPPFSLPVPYPCDQRARVCPELLDGFSVLGWETASRIDEAYPLGSLQALLELAMSEGQIAKQPAEPLAQVLLGALNQAALAIARADDVPASRRRMGKTIGRLLAGLA